MEIKKDIKNSLMKRREVEFIIEGGKNPSFIEIAKLTADNFKDSEENIIVEKIGGKFGRNTFLIKACIYETKDLKETAEKKLKKAKKEAAPAAK